MRTYNPYTQTFLLKFIETSKIIVIESDIVSKTSISIGAWRVSLRVMVEVTHNVVQLVQW